MIFRPLFWIYLIFHFKIFVYLTNRIGIRQPNRVHEILWTLFFLAAQSIPSVGLARNWDFSLSALSGLSWSWKAWLGLVAGWVMFLWIEHAFWYLLRMKPVRYRTLCQKNADHPHWSVPFIWFKNFGFKNQIYDLEVVEYEVELPGWPRVFSGLSLVQLSDFHYGKFIHADYLRFVFAEARRLKPDLLLLTGDYISFEKDIPVLEEFLKAFKTPLGAYALLGNHDHWADGAAVRRALEKGGFRVLQNEVVYIKKGKKKLAILGADDIWVGKKDETPLLKAQADAKLFLAHQPDHFKLGKKIDAHLQLSGHCHGGQICFPIIGPLIVPADEGRKFAGGFLRENGTTLFIHRGIGCYPPLRTYCPPQVVKMTLRSA